MKMRACPTNRRRAICYASMLAIGGAIIAQPALAQGRSGHSTSVQYGQEVALQVVSYFGNCFAANSTKTAFRVLATAPSSREESQIIRESVLRDDAQCLPSGTLSTQPTPVRGAIVEGLWRKRIAVPEELKLSAPEPAAVQDLSGAARCYASRHAADAAALLETKAGGRKEYAVVKKLLPELGKCVPGGIQLNYPATLIRYRVAEALYRLGNVRAEPQRAS